MKRVILASLTVMTLPLTAVAQDDIYFVPTKANVIKEARDNGIPRDTYYSGSDRNIDEYNRRGTYVHEIDSTGNDIIDFDAVSGVYPDTTYAGMGDDYEYTRRMSRFDDYSWSDPYWAGYYAGRTSAWGWYDPWYASAWYYDPWYYDPWYAGWGSPWHYSWYHPWHYGWGGYWGWGGGHWWGGPHYAVVGSGGLTGTRNHVRGGGIRQRGVAGSAASVSSGIAQRNRTSASGVRNRSYSASERFSVNRNNNTTIRTTSPSQNTSSYGNSSTGGSFGGNRSGSSVGGGIRSGGSSGGGSFRGRR